MSLCKNTKFRKLFEQQNKSLKPFVLTLAQFPNSNFVIFLIFNFFVGFIILAYTKTLLIFLPHLISLTINMVITFSIGKKYAQTIKFFDCEIIKSRNKENSELKTACESFFDKAFCPCNLFFCIVILLIFFWSIFSQHYITFDLVGCYAIGIVTITVSMSVIGYTQYLWLLWFLFKVSKCSSMNFNKSAPAYTPFLVKIGELTNCAKWCFFFEGFLYVFEYYILIPKGSITLSGINMPDKISFLITWGVIFVAIIIAFPIIAFVQEILLLHIVNHLKEQQIRILSIRYNSLFQNPSVHYNDVYICNKLINNLISSPDYPVKIQRMGPMLVSIASFSLHIVTLITQFPQIENWINQWVQRNM